MNEGLLTQEEIDALLRAQAGGKRETGSPVLDPEEIDALKEIGNIVMGSASTVLSMLVNRPVEISVKDIKELRIKDIYNLRKGSALLLKVNFTEGLSGESVIILSEKDALYIADFMMGGDGSSLPGELNELYQSAVNEALSQMMGSMTTTLSTLLGGKYLILPPNSEKIVFESRPSLISGLGDEDVVAYISYHLRVGDIIEDEMVQLLPIPMAKNMVSKLLSAAGEAIEEPVSKSEPQPVRQSIETQRPTAAPESPKRPKTPPVEAKPVQFAPLQPQATPSVPPKNIDLILDIPLKVTVELGKAEMYIRDILNLGPGSIIELDKLAGEPVEVLVNGKPVARGEVVVIDENFGVRITDIISPRERLEKLT